MKILELKSIVYELKKKSLDGLTSRLEITEEIVNMKTNQ